ncbi:MAG: hypothetical protein WHT46_07420 [Candidatus Geothermincolales bacterium]
MEYRGKPVSGNREDRGRGAVTGPRASDPSGSDRCQGGNRGEVAHRGKRDARGSEEGPAFSVSPGLLKEEARDGIARGSCPFEG